MCDYQNNSSNAFQGEDPAFINFLHEEINNLKDIDENHEGQQSQNTDECNTPNIQTLEPSENTCITKKENILTNHKDPSNCIANKIKRKKGNNSKVIGSDNFEDTNSSLSYINDETTLHLARNFYKRQIEIAEEQHQLFINKVKKEEDLLEEQHRAKMSILEKQQELANTQLEFWAQKKLLDN